MIASRNAQNIEAFRVGLHQAVLDAVVDHLDEAAGAARPAVHIAVLDARVALAATRCRRNGTLARRQGAKDRIEALDGGFRPADHQAIAAFEAPTAAAGAAIDVVDLLCLECAGATNVVLVEGVAAIDDAVARLQPSTERVGRRLRRFPSRHHHPDGTGLTEASTELGNVAGAQDVVAGEGGNGSGVAVEHDTLVPPAHEPAYDIAAHATEADDAKLHCRLPIAPVAGLAARPRLPQSRP